MTLPPLEDTIAAIATAPGAGAIGVVRVSGPDAYAVADALFTARSGARPSSLPAGRVVYGSVGSGLVGTAADARRIATGGDRSGAGTDLVDEALLLTFRAPHSYTGQDVVELQTHGGAAVLRTVLDLCLAAGARQAGPGEFTLRAYLNGRIDLAQAESVLDMVTAASDAARRAAAMGLSGALSRRLDAVQDDLIAAHAAVQAAFDYPEEGVRRAELAEPLARVLATVDALLATAAAGRLSRHGARLAVLGRPNAGKSSLLNALVGYQRALVSPTPGTTRDYVETPLVIDGVPVLIIDTAGIRATGDAVEADGVALARDIARGADVRLLLVDGSRPLDDEDRALLAELVGRDADAASEGALRRTVVVISKADLAQAWSEADLDHAMARVPYVRVSSRTGAGLDELRELLSATLVGQAAHAELWLTNERHVQALTTVRERVSAAAGAPDDVASLELLDALTALAAVTGRDGVSAETLAAIFATFCVGK